MHNESCRGLRSSPWRRACPSAHLLELVDQSLCPSTSRAFLGPPVLHLPRDTTRSIATTSGRRLLSSLVSNAQPLSCCCPGIRVGPGKQPGPSTGCTGCLPGPRCFASSLNPGSCPAVNCCCCRYLRLTAGCHTDRWCGQLPRIQLTPPGVCRPDVDEKPPVLCTHDVSWL